MSDKATVTVSNEDAEDFKDHALTITMTDGDGRVVRCRIPEEMLEDPPMLSSWLNHVLKDPRFVVDHG